VEDDPVSQCLLQSTLERLGHDVATASTAAEAEAHLVDEVADLVILDIGLPDRSGIELLADIRQRLSQADLPVIMATSHDHTEYIVRALEAGANDYVTKPYDLPVLLARLDTQIALREARRELRLRVTEVEALAARLEQNNRFVRGVFGRYMSDEVVDRLLEDPEGLAMGGEEREVTAMFTDLRRFTPITEQMRPERVIRLLNLYLEQMIEIIEEHRGLLVNVMGDGLLVVFGAPMRPEDHAIRAVNCALAMQRAMVPVNARNRELDLPELHMGIGISTGKVVMGNIGSTRRANYSVIGPTVNLAARIEGLTRDGDVLISQSTARAIEGARLSVTDRKRVELKGFTGGVEVYALSGKVRKPRSSMPHPRVDDSDPSRPG